MDGRNDLEMGPQPRSSQSVDLADPNGSTHEASSVNERLLDKDEEEFQVKLLNFIETRDGTHELSEISYKTTSEFSRALSSQDSQRMRLDPSDNCHQILIVTVPGYRDSPDESREIVDDLSRDLKALEPYLQHRQAPEESQKLLREFRHRNESMALDDRQVDRNFRAHWQAESTTATRDLSDVMHYDERYPTELAMPLGIDIAIVPESWGKIKCAVEYSLTQEVCCLCMPQTILLVHTEGYLHSWARPQSRDTTGSVTQSLIAGLRGLDRQTVSTPELFRFIQKSICQMMLDNEWEVLSILDRVLGGFDCYMLQSVWIASSRLQAWMLGNWRAYLHSRSDFNLQLTAIIKSATNPGEMAEQDLRSAHSRLKARAEAVLRHFESTFSATIGTMSFIESTKAINQAEQVKKLTQLAFCFIPLSFICSMFSMNVTELASVSLWVWATTSVLLLLIVYIILYFRTIWDFMKLDVGGPVGDFFRWHILWHITRWRPDDWPYDW